jgi:hypothetical protein
MMKHGPWIDADILFIREHWEDLDDGALAAALERRMSSVEAKRRELGLKRQRGRAAPTEYLGRHGRPPRLKARMLRAATGAAPTLPQTWCRSSAARITRQP